MVGISAPGIFLSIRGFNVPGDPLHYLETNLVNENDIVPQIDRLQVIRHNADLLPMTTAITVHLCLAAVASGR